jgi:CheY-like chemotaxis protein
MSQLIAASIGSAIQIETRFPLSLPPVKADANQLELALLNLVVNSRDATTDGGRIIISGRLEAVTSPSGTILESGQYVCLSVADTGSGMDEATLSRATEPFFTTKGVGRGTGLGLSMVLGVAEQSGGQFVLHSRKGEGTTAEIWLPEASADLVASSALDSEAELPVAISPVTVLVVDDDPLVLMNTAAMLDDLGHRVLEASSAAQALRILRRSENIDIMITDQVMPNMTGAELIARVRLEWPNLSVVLATGYAELPRDIDPALPKLAKPYRQETLARVIAEQSRSRQVETVLHLRAPSKAGTG